MSTIVAQEWMGEHCLISNFNSTIGSRSLFYSGLVFKIPLFLSIQLFCFTLI